MATVAPPSNLHAEKHEATPSTTPGTSRLGSPDMEHLEPLLGPGSVGTAIGERGVIICRSILTLTDAADLLIGSDHTSALVMDDVDVVLGVLTENDLLAAFVEGVGREAKVARWLRGGDARFPRGALPVLTVERTTPLVWAAHQMQMQRTEDRACHHLLVKSPKGQISWILSAMDIVRALVVQASNFNPPVVPGSTDETPTTIMEQYTHPIATLGQTLMGDKKVADAMKARVELPELPLGAPLAQAFREMFMSRQNCALVVDDDKDKRQRKSADADGLKRVHGLITPRDLLHAFAEGTPADTTLEGWLRGTKSRFEMRTIAPSRTLLEAAEEMASMNMHHLVVVEPGSSDVQGVLSCLDVVCVVGHV